MRDYTPEALAGLLPFPSSDAHKYSRGKLLVVGGSFEFPGAAALAALAGQRAGAGYTEVFAEEPVVGVVQQCAPSLVVRSWHEWDALPQVASTEERPLACVVGCGIDAQDAQTAKLIQQVLTSATAPVLVDGGALGMFPSGGLASRLEQRARSGFETVITPHAGEAARLAEPFRIPGEDPVLLAASLAHAYHAVCVLKGSNTYISDGESTYCMEEGGSALAKAGTGDVLAGILGAFLAQGIETFDACVLGAILHARAANMAAEDFTSISVTPEDVIAYIPQAICALAGAVQ